MLRTIFIPDKKQISIPIPEKFIGKQIEVIVFPVNEFSISDNVETHFASERILAKDWLNSEEDQAWKDL